MNYLFDIGHPGQVHLFRNTISILKCKGNKVIVTVKEIPSAIELLEKYDIDYISIGKKFKPILLKGLSQLRYNYRLLKIVRKEYIEIGIGSSITVAHVSRISKMRSIILDDDDPNAVKLFVKYAHPFADIILSPSALSNFRTSKKDITYPGTHELFYLHPNYFTPNAKILDDLGLKLGEPYFVLRFVAVEAYHDIGAKGLSLDQKKQIINKIKRHGKVFITSEKKIESELKQYKLSLSPEKIHHLIYFAQMFIGDSQTMTSEAAILGTPAIKCNSFAHRLSVPNLLEEKYKLCYSFNVEEFESMTRKLDELLTQTNIKEEWKERVIMFISDSIDPTAFLIWFLETFPSSIAKMKSDPELICSFK